MSGSDVSKILTQLPKLNGQNYVSWSETAELIFAAFGYGGFLKQEEMDKDTEARVRSVLLLSMEEEVRDALKEKATSKEIWKAAKTKYGSPGRLVIARLRAEFYGRFLRDGERVQQYINEKRQLSLRLKNAGKDVSADVVDVVLSGVSFHFESLVEALENDTDLSLAKLEERLLRAEETREIGGSAEMANRATTKTTGVRKCDTCGKTGHTSQRCWKSRVCSRCGQTGHIQRYCRTRMPDDTSAAKTNAIQNDDIETYNAFSALTSANSRFISGNDGKLIADSGTSSHMTADRSKLENYRPRAGCQVELADDKRIPVAGEGVVGFRFAGAAQNESMKTPMLHVPDLGRNDLFSVLQATKGGNRFIFSERGCELQDGKGNILANGFVQANTYIMDVLPAERSKAAVATKAAGKLVTRSELDLWHERLAHRSKADILRLSNHEMVTGCVLRGTYQDSDCVGCAMGKAKRQPFPRHSQPRNRKLLELFHSDGCGPFPVPSFDGARYFVTYVEDVSRFRFTFLLGEKSAQLETFKKLRTMVEKQYEGEVKVLRADNGGEYVSRASKEFF